jgi:thiamine pyrophosphokinase
MMKNNLVSILLSKTKEADLPLIQGDVIGVDRGCAIAIKNKLSLTMAIGDFDSLSSSDYALLKNNKTPLKTFPTSKDKSDAELAIDWAIEQGYKTLIILGFSGGRLDHQQALIQALFKYKHSGLRLQTPDQSIQYLSKGFHSIQKEKPYQVFSMFTFSKAVVSIKGATYPLNKTKIDVTSIYTLSNGWISQAPAELTLHAGEMLLFRSRLF